MLAESISIIILHFKVILPQITYLPTVLDIRHHEDVYCQTLLVQDTALGFVDEMDTIHISKLSMMYTAKKFLAFFFIFHIY